MVRCNRAELLRAEVKGRRRRQVRGSGKSGGKSCKRERQGRGREREGFGRGVRKEGARWTEGARWNRAWVCRCQRILCCQRRKGRGAGNWELQLHKRHSSLVYWKLRSGSERKRAGEHRCKLGWRWRWRWWQRRRLTTSSNTGTSPSTSYAGTGTCATWRLPGQESVWLHAQWSSGAMLRPQKLLQLGRRHHQQGLPSHMREM